MLSEIYNWFTEDLTPRTCKKRRHCWKSYKVNLRQLRRHIAAGRVRIEFALPHALTEAF